MISTQDEQLGVSRHVGAIKFGKGREVLRHRVEHVAWDPLALEHAQPRGAHGKVHRGERVGGKDNAHVEVWEPARHLVKPAPPVHPTVAELPSPPLWEIPRPRKVPREVHQPHPVSHVPEPHSPPMPKLLEPSHHLEVAGRDQPPGEEQVEQPGVVSRGHREVAHGPSVEAALVPEIVKLVPVERDVPRLPAHAVVIHNPPRRPNRLDHDAGRVLDPVGIESLRPRDRPAHLRRKSRRETAARHPPSIVDSVGQDFPPSKPVMIVHRVRAAPFGCRRHPPLADRRGSVGMTPGDHTEDLACRIGGAVTPGEVGATRPPEGRAEVATVPCARESLHCQHRSFRRHPLLNGTPPPALSSRVSLRPRRVPPRHCRRMRRVTAFVGNEVALRACEPCSETSLDFGVVMVMRRRPSSVLMDNVWVGGAGSRPHKQGSIESRGPGWQNIVNQPQHIKLFKRLSSLGRGQNKAGQNERVAAVHCAVHPDRAVWEAVCHVGHVRGGRDVAGRRGVGPSARVVHCPLLQGIVVVIVDATLHREEVPGAHVVHKHRNILRVAPRVRHPQFGNGRQPLILEPLVGDGNRRGVKVEQEPPGPRGQLRVGQS
eukprot:m.465215 g.465215  ORF g.465215 m.465215 type:complete len:599 (+) comp24036_c0_seq1:72-1868(+)